MKFNPEILGILATSVNDEKNPVVYLGIDPGESNGVCGFDEKYRLVFMYTVMYPDVGDFLELFKNLKLIVCEDFFLYPDKAMQQVYSEMKTSKVIGSVVEFTRKNKIQLVMQKATIKSTGYKWVGKKPLPKHNPANHELDAFVHFMYWAVRTGKINAADLL
jgi:hypothetical protein